MATDDDCRRVIESLKRNKKNRSPSDLVAILEAFGFKEHRRKAGSHRPFTKPGCEIGVSVPDGGSKGVLVAYVQKVIRALEECCDE